MCGICGFVGKGDISDLKKMNFVMFHRGPDEEGIWYNTASGVFLGHRRLSIIDLAGGQQPMWTKDGKLGVVFNGEIYNYIELRKELIKKGYIFQTDHSDTEVLLHGYREWGFDLTNKLNGMWAFCIYDINNKRMFFSRDRFGKKPFFYSFQNGTFAFASELNALIQHSEIKKKISRQSLKKYFAYGYIPAPNSLYEDIYKLPGGYNLTINIEDFSISIKKYWDFELEPTERIPKNPEEEWGEQLRYLLEQSVKRRLISDVPLGVFLSGGIDSSSITAFAAKILGDNRIKTFSIGFKEASFDETQYAERVSKLFHTNHYMEILSMERAKDLAGNIIGKLDEPMGDSSLLPTYLLCGIARKQVTVALGGDGGDELFAGYDPFKALKKAELYSNFVPRPVHMAIRLLTANLPTSHRNMSLDFKIKRTLRGITYPKKIWNPVWLGTLEPKELEELFIEPMDLECVYSEAIEYWDQCTQKDIVDKTLQFYTKMYLQDDILVKADRASMMNSLEVRAPFLDIELVDFVRKIPHQYKYHNGETKYILKKALEPVLPNEILYRPKKGFGVPIGEWFKNGGLAFDPNCQMTLFNTDWMQAIFNRHRERKEDNRLFLWNYFVLSNFNVITENSSTK